MDHETMLASTSHHTTTNETPAASLHAIKTVSNISQGIARNCERGRQENQFCSPENQFRKLLYTGHLTRET